LVAARNQYVPISLVIGSFMSRSMLGGLKLFVSFEQNDLDIAKWVDKNYTEQGWDVFIAYKSIPPGKEYENIINNEISSSDIFIILITSRALNSKWVEKEFWEAKRLQKIVIPCKISEVVRSELRWGLEKMQYIEFTDKNDLIRKLDSLLKEVANQMLKEIARWDDPVAAAVHLRNNRIAFLRQFFRTNWEANISLDY
jgi:hypothetical protein